MQKSPRQRPSRYRKRMLLLQAACVLALGAVAVRIHYVQNAYGPRLLKSADKIQNTSQVLIAERGSLVDRNGNRLAYDVPAYMLDIKTGSFSDLHQLAIDLSPILQKSTDVVESRLDSGHNWVRWPDPILETDKQKLYTLMKKDKSSDGKDHTSDVTFTPTEERIYPYGSFAANTIGYVTHEGKGATGLEAEYNDVLSGTNGELAYTQDIWGFPLQTTVHTTKAAVPGKDVQLTIDQTIQGYVETKMDELVSKYKPDHAAIIVLDPNTGEILAMSSRPTYDPNKYWEGNKTALSSNWAVNEAFEPGSTFKALTLVAGLATQAISLGDTVMSGHMRVADTSISDWNHVGWGLITYRTALLKSSNVGFATAALKVGWTNLLKYMQTFGFLDKTGIDLPAEASSLIFGKESRGQVQLATSGFGQGIAVTPLQQVAAYAAIANGGKLIRPHLVKDIINPDTGKVEKTFNPVVMNPQVAPPDVVRQVSDTLIGDVNDPQGIDDTAKIPGYNVAGKTGTANIENPATYKYYTDRFNVSFIGYAPGNHPQVEVFVTVNNPKTNVFNTWGSTIAAPVAKDILQQCIQYYHIPPETAVNTKGGSTPGQAVQNTISYVQTPKVVGKTVVDAKSTLKSLGLTADVLGQGGIIQSQWPAAGVEVPKGSMMYLFAPKSGIDSGTMPDLTGLSMREAGNILAAQGVQMAPKGYGFVVSQSIKPGDPVKRGTTVTITFAPPEDPVDQALSNTENKASSDNSTN